MTTGPEARTILQTVIDRIKSGEHLKSNSLLWDLSLVMDALTRRKRVMRAPQTSEPMTDAIRAQIWVLHNAHPKASQQWIANQLNIDKGRVSETIAGYRT